MNMSTYVKVFSHNEIDAGIRSLNLGKLRKVQSLQAETLTTVILRVLTIYKGVSPLLHYIASWMILPLSWRNGLTAFIEALDLLAAMPIVLTPSSPSPSVPIVASAASDTTTTDPTSTDPGFKAGKDL
jgi:hypothetical protein